MMDAPTRPDAHTPTPSGRPLAPHAALVVAMAILSGVLYSVFVQSLGHVSKEGNRDELLWFFNGFCWDTARSWFTLAAVGVAIAAYLAAWLGYGWACAAVGGRTLPEALKADSRTFILSFSVAFVLGVRCNVDRPKFFHTIAAFYVAFIAWKLIYFLRGLLRREGVPSAGQVFALFLATYAAVNLLHSRTRPMGDEPHYLVMAHSLVHDGDFELSNNYASRDYRRFFDQDEIHWHGLARELPDGRKVVYSWHDAGLAVLIAPGYAVSPRFWPLFILNAVCAALMTTVLLLLKELGLGERERLYGTLAFGLTPPIIFYANQVFPEVPAAFLLFLGMRQILRLPEQSVRRCLLIGLCVCLLPWLGRRFGLLCIWLFVLGLVRMRHSLGSWLGLCLPNVISAFVMREVFKAMYGAFTVTAGWWDLFRGAWYLVKPHAVLGLLFDREAGLLTFAPIYAFAVAGCWMVMRRSAWRAAMLLGVFGVQYAFVATDIQEWQGGFSPPPRYIVCITPIAAVFAALGCAAGLRTSVARRVWKVCLGYTAVITLLLVCNFRLVYHTHDGGNNLFKKFRAGPFDLNLLFPTFNQGLTACNSVHAAVFLVAIALLTWHLVKRSPVIDKTS